MLGYGQNIVSARRYETFQIGQFTVNGTASPNERFHVPVGGPNIRVLGVHVSASAIPSDPDGTMLLNALVNDVSEGADDTLVASQDLEALVTAANRVFECTLAADGTEEIRTLSPGDTIRFTLVNNSAAITTNPFVNVTVEYILVPRLQSQEDEPHYVGFPSQMSDF